jgi:hypothetical protein
MEQKGSSSVSGLSMIQKFDGKNYKVWAWEMELLLVRERAWTIVCGTENPPPGPQDEIQEVRDKDGKVIIAGLSAVEPSKKYIDYMWRYHEAVRMIFISLERSLQLQYMDLRNPAELWKAIKKDYIGELQKSQIWIRRDLYEVKLKDYGSVKTYSLRIQELIDEYQAGAEDPSDKISERDHVFFLLNSVPQSEDWDLEIRLITAQMKVLGKDPKEVIKKLCDREDSIKNSKGIPSDVALYTKSGGFATGTKKDAGKPDTKKDKKDKKEKRVCTYCEKEGHLEEKCWAKHGKPDWKKDKSEETEDKEDKDKKSATANLTTTSTSDTLWMAVEDSAVTMGNFYLDGACDAHACNRRDLFDSKTFVELKEGDRTVRGFDGSQQSAKGIGTIRLPMCLGKGRPVVWARIPDVLYLPGSANLISQGTLMDRGIRIKLINGYGAKLYDKAGRMIATARLRNKMLPLDIAWQSMPRESFGVNAGTRV